MAVNGNSWFAEVFDRGYAAAVTDGGASWVGLDSAGQVQMSLTQFVRRFRLGSARLTASVTGNVMAAEPYRTFFPAMALFRRMLSDTKHRGEVDFVYGDPTPRASAVCKAVGMAQVGSLDRLVLPIADTGFAKNVAARIFSVTPLLLGSRTAASVYCSPAANRDLGEFESAAGPDDRLLPHHPLSVMRRRYSEFPGSRDFVVELRWDRTATDWDALVLLRFPDDTRMLSVLSVRRRSDISLRAVVPSLVSVARSLGAHRLQVETLLESNMAREFCSLGFRPRGDTLPIFAKACSDAGDEAVRKAGQWELTALDLER